MAMYYVKVELLENHLFFLSRPSIWVEPAQLSRKSPYNIQNSSLASYTLREHSDNHQTSASKHQNHTIQNLQV